jgi:hypothetical protein
MKRLALTVFAAVAIAAPIPYDPTTGLKAMYYAGAAYCLVDDLNIWSCGEPCDSNSGVNTFIPIENPYLNTFGYAIYNHLEDEIVVVFRGTQIHTILNWISDFDIHMEQYKALNGSLVHAGFYETY